VPFFDFSGLCWAGSNLVVPVANHYTRAVENQLDVPHLPFIHHNTIGRGLPTAVNVHTEVEGDRIRVSREGATNGLIELLGPNLWRLQTGPATQFLAFVPVDDTHMRY
jgi:phenylpropionate dioxygenase-like ring-hydroxylating dioxygenase large terminal subunit